MEVYWAQTIAYVWAIGVENRGQDLLEEVLTVPNIQLAAMADVSSRRRDAVKKKISGIHTFDDHRRLLDMKDIEVIVASPLHMHARHFLDTLASGKDLYSEKTMTWPILEAEQCLAAATQSGRIVQIGLQWGKFRRLTGCKKVDQGRNCWQSHPGGIMDKPQHSPRERPMGASCSIRLYCPERQLVCISERPAGPALRSIPPDQLATVVGVFRRERDRKHGASDRMDHGRSRSAIAHCRFYVGRSIFRAGWSSVAGHNRRDSRFP